MIMDHDCTKVALFFLCMKTIDMVGIVELYAARVFPLFEASRKVILDQDPQFTAKFVKGLCDQLKIQQNISMAYHPQTDGQSK